jgi:hypothetical protein
MAPVRVALAVVICAVVMACGGVKTPATDERYERLVVEGAQTQNGIYDPSVEYDTSGRIGWLAYSTVTGDAKPVGPYVNTEIARSDDHGRSWRFVKRVNQSYDDTLDYIDGSKVTGVWRYEVPTLVHDPGDRGREWKLFTHKYFWNEKQDRMVAYGWIAMRSASSADGEWSAEIAMLGAGQFPPPPYEKVRARVSLLDPGLDDYLVYTEPGAYQRDGILYLSLTAIKKDGHDSVILLSSADHGETWKYVAKVATSADARALGYVYFDGTSIAEENGRVFLLASPAVALENHAGTMVFEFEDLTGGKLVRDQSGIPLVRQHILPQSAFPSERGGGQGDYDERNTYGGLLFPQLNITEFPEVFQIFNTKRRLIGTDRSIGTETK